MDDAISNTGITIPFPSPRSKQPSDSPIHELARPDLNWYHLISVAFQGTLQEHASPSILHAKPAAVHARWTQICREEIPDTARASVSDAGEVAEGAIDVDEARDEDGDVDMQVDGADVSPVTSPNTTSGSARRGRGRPRKKTMSPIAAAKRTLQQLSDISDRQWGGSPADKTVQRPNTRSRSTRWEEPPESPTQNRTTRVRSQRRKEAVPTEDAEAPVEEKRRTRGGSSRRQEAAAETQSDQRYGTEDDKDIQPPDPPIASETEAPGRRVTRSGLQKRRVSMATLSAAPPAPTAAVEPPPATISPDIPPADTPVLPVPITRRKPATPPRNLSLRLPKILFFFTVLPKPRGRPAQRPLSFAFSYSFFRSSISLGHQQRRTLSSDKLVMLCMRARGNINAASKIAESADETATAGTTKGAIGEAESSGVSASAGADGGESEVALSRKRKFVP
ncbi:hypothetical protein ABW21_db0208801 [Orbilia brochopaga]|nr:hypothetical protein ABW21_db0208801 [Drechslerella brochopaga]